MSTIKSSLSIRRERRCAACVGWRGEPLGRREVGKGDEIIEGKRKRAGIRSRFRKVCLYKHKQQTTIQKPIAPEASSGGRVWADMTEGFHLEVTHHLDETCDDLT